MIGAALGALLLGFIGAVVWTTLDKLRAQPLAFMVIKAQPVTPFREMRGSENVFVIGPTPNSDQRLRADGAQAVGCESVGSATHLYGLTAFDSLWSEEKYDGIVAISMLPFVDEFRTLPRYVDAQVSRWGAPGIFPSWLASEPRKIKMRIGSKIFWNISGDDASDYGEWCKFRIKTINKYEGALTRFESQSAFHPKLFGRLPEGEGEQCDNQPCESGDNAVMLINSHGFALINESSMVDEADESGDFAARIGIFFVVLYCVNAIIKRMTKPDK